MVTLVRNVAMKKMLRIGASIPESSNISDQWIIEKILCICMAYLSFSSFVPNWKVETARTRSSPVFLWNFASPWEVRQ
jgi:hypothetical protein